MSGPSAGPTVAADAERSRLAFGEAAAHLARARRALEDAGEADISAVLGDLLLDEADATRPQW